MKTLFAFAFIVTLTTTAGAAEQLRYFESVDDASKIYMLEYDQGKEERALFKLEGVKHDATGKVWAMVNEPGRGPRFVSIGKVSGLAFMDYGKKGLVEGSIKPLWTLHGTKGNDKSVSYVEKTPPAGVTAETIRQEYEKHEGQVPEAKDATQMSQAMGSMLEKDCKGKVTINYAPANFSGGSKPPLYKVFAVAQGISELCREDEDARKAIVDQGKFSVAAVDSGSELAAAKSGKELTLKVSPTSGNTRAMTKKLLMENL